MTGKELTEIIISEIDKKFNALIETLNFKSEQTLSQTSFEKQKMNHLMGDMWLPQGVFREFLRSILPITITELGNEGDLVGIGKDEDGDLYTVPQASQTFVRGVVASRAFETKSDIENVTDVSVDKRVVYIEDEKTFYFSEMNASLVDLELLVDTDIFIVGEYTLRKIIALADIPSEWVIKIGNLYYDKKGDSLGKSYAIEEMERIKAEFESKMSEYEERLTALEQA
jgi:hypothetical protein